MQDAGCGMRDAPKACGSWALHPEPWILYPDESVVDRSKGGPLPSTDHETH